MMMMIALMLMFSTDDDNNKHICALLLCQISTHVVLVGVLSPVNPKDYIRADTCSEDSLTNQASADVGTVVWLIFVCLFEWVGFCHVNIPEVIFPIFSQNRLYRKRKNSAAMMN